MVKKKSTVVNLKTIKKAIVRLNRKSNALVHTKELVSYAPYKFLRALSKVAPYTGKAYHFT